ncbi:MAG: diadenylate cyclase [Nitrospinota bacterium]|nr:diadenylate cyclase [Nitrospinota bacterium]
MNEISAESISNLNKDMISSALEICEKNQADAIFLYADAIDNFDFFEKLPSGFKIFFTTSSSDTFNLLVEKKFHVFRLPKLSLNRVDTIKMGVVIALSESAITTKDTIVCLSGLSAEEQLDTMMIFNLEKEEEMFQTSSSQSSIKTEDPKVFETILSLTLELSAEGREGKPCGSLFVLGDHELVLQYSRQLIINPFHGYPEEQRNIMDPSLRETLKEFSAIDGAFVIRGDGIVEAAGRHLSAAPEENLPTGLGSRHMAAAGITQVSSATSFAISESTGTVSVFRDGKILMQISKSQPQSNSLSKKKKTKVNQKKNGR